MASVDMQRKKDQLSKTPNCTAIVGKVDSSLNGETGAVLRLHTGNRIELIKTGSNSNLRFILPDKQESSGYYYYERELTDIQPIEQINEAMSEDD